LRKEWTSKILRGSRRSLMRVSNRFGDKSRPVRVPNFESGIISEPLLAFGGRHEHVDPKTGLGLYGPYSIAGQARAPLRSIIVGIIGPPAMIADAEAWLRACQGVLTNDGRQPFLYPHFPGFNSSPPFECDLIFGDTWRESIRDTDFAAAVKIEDYYERIRNVIRLYLRAIEDISGRDPSPNVVLCCIPQVVVDSCTVQRTRKIAPKKVRLKTSQGVFNKVQPVLPFDGMDSVQGTEDEEWGHQNLRRGLKAEAMRFGLPTQLVWPKTLRLSAQAAEPGERRVQDVATRAWNFTTALYHKAGGSPWRLSEIEPGACFVGVSFYREVLEPNPQLRTSMAQAFTAAGDGYVLRGNAFEWNEGKGGRSPHLDRNLAASLLRDVIELYQRQNRGSLPTRIIVHKSSRFWEEEIAGFEEACQIVPRRDFVALGSRGVQFYRTGDYPALRGTYIKFSESDFILYTSGYIPFLRTYPGARVPQPLEILEYSGDSPWDVVLREVLSLTKMNWNTADFAAREPITLAFSRRVGEILAEVPPDVKVRPEYRFYM
jgi:hypothetical protein